MLAYGEIVEMWDDAPANPLNSYMNSQSRIDWQSFRGTCFVS
jgi:hypothetical protein